MSSPLASIKALLFDVFGTVVDWRSSVTDELILRAHRKVSPTAPTFPQQSGNLPGNGSGLSDAQRAKLCALTDADWGRFAQQWRDSYIKFTMGFDSATMPWKSIDDHHRDSLGALLEQWGLEGVYSAQEIESLSFVWHRLTPWPDSPDGLRAMRDLGITTATLSNGNVTLVQDLSDFGDLGFAPIFSAETFKVYKPNPKTYLGAVEKLGLQPSEVAMVATHMKDLAAAQSHGLRTIYVQRTQEEAWKEDDDGYIKAKAALDMWVGLEEDGMITAAKGLHAAKA